MIESREITTTLIPDLAKDLNVSELKIHALIRQRKIKAYTAKGTYRHDGLVRVSRDEVLKALNCIQERKPSIDVSVQKTRGWRTREQKSKMKELQDLEMTDERIAVILGVSKITIKRWTKEESLKDKLNTMTNNTDS